MHGLIGARSAGFRHQWEVLLLRKLLHRPVPPVNPELEFHEAPLSHAFSGFWIPTNHDNRGTLYGRSDPLITRCSIPSLSIAAIEQLGVEITAALDFSCMSTIITAGLDTCRVLKVVV